MVVLFTFEVQVYLLEATLQYPPKISHGIPNRTDYSWLGIKGVIKEYSFKNRQISIPKYTTGHPIPTTPWEDKHPWISPSELLKLRDQKHFMTPKVLVSDLEHSERYKSRWLAGGHDPCCHTDPSKCSRILSTVCCSPSSARNQTPGFPAC